MYPHHDKKNISAEFTHSKAKMLPTFKGLLMAITSPETRFKCSENDNPNKINYISSSNNKIPLVNGLNAVIGENGSGKSTILSLISDQTNKKHVKDLIESNQLDVNCQVSSHRIKYVSQGKIVEDYFKSGLFSSGEDDVYNEVDHNNFLNIYNKYFEDLTSIIETAIEKQEAVKILDDLSVQYEPGMNKQTYYIQVENNINTNSDENEHSKKLKKVKEAYDEVLKWKFDGYYSGYAGQIDEVLNLLVRVN